MSEKLLNVNNAVTVTECQCNSLPNIVRPKAREEMRMKILQALFVQNSVFSLGDRLGYLSVIASGLFLYTGSYSTATIIPPNISVGFPPAVNNTDYLGRGWVAAPAATFG
jgi:hypothetical protein